VPKIRVLPYLGPQEGAETHRIDFDNPLWDSDRMTDKWLEGWPDKRGQSRRKRSKPQIGFYLGRRVQKEEE